MTITQIARRVREERMARRVRLMRGIQGDPKHYDTREVQYGIGRPKGWTTIDEQFAEAIMAVHDALPEHMRTRLDTIPLAQLVSFCWRMVA